MVNWYCATGAILAWKVAELPAVAWKPGFRSTLEPAVKVTPALPPTVKLPLEPAAVMELVA